MYCKRITLLLIEDHLQNICNNINRYRVKITEIQKEKTRKTLFFKGVQSHNQISNDMKDETILNIFK